MGIIKRKKYEFTGKTKVITQSNESHTLHQIKALKDFRDIKAGYLGGWIEKEENLSQEGDCWVYSNAMVFGNAKVYRSALIYDYAQVSGNAQVYGNAHVSGYAQVKATAKVYDEADLSGHANILNDSQICGTSVIKGKIRVKQKNLVLKDVYLESDDYELTVF